MKIILTGFMGAGKTSTGKALAQKIGWPYIEMDEEVLLASGRQSIREIFQKDGETRFRELEIKVARRLMRRDKVVIATGGGVVMNRIILDYLKERGKVFFLDADFRVIKKRLSGDKTRPLFQNCKEAKALYQFRLPLYRQYADYCIDANGTAQEASREIRRKLKL